MWQQLMQILAQKQGFGLPQATQAGAPQVSPQSPNKLQAPISGWFGGNNITYGEHDLFDRWMGMGKPQMGVESGGFGNIFEMLFKLYGNKGANKLPSPMIDTQDGGRTYQGPGPVRPF